MSSCAFTYYVIVNHTKLRILIRWAFLDFERVRCDRALQVAPGRMQLPYEEAGTPKLISIGATERIVLMFPERHLGIVDVGEGFFHTGQGEDERAGETETQHLCGGIRGLRHIRTEGGGPNKYRLEIRIVVHEESDTRHTGHTPGYPRGCGTEQGSGPLLDGGSSIFHRRSHCLLMTIWLSQ